MATFTLQDFPYTSFPRSARVLDLGFGKADQMRSLRAAGCRPAGIDLNAARAVAARQEGLAVCRAQAEHLPFVSGTFDGVVCKVVIPYTDEAMVVAEIARVLKPGGIAKVSYHGLGYALHVLTERNWRRRVYAGRTLVNSWVYWASGRRLPGFLGSALYQSRGRLNRYYKRAGLTLVEDRPSPGFLGGTVFIYHTLRKDGISTEGSRSPAAAGHQG